MRQIALSGAVTLLVLGCGAFSHAQAQAQAQTQMQMQMQAGAPTPQQAQQARQDRNAAEAYLQREEAAATGRQSQSTDRANQDASVSDEASGASAGERSARSTNPNASAGGSTRGMTGSGAGSSAGAPPAYGPVLTPRQPPAAGSSRRDPAEVHDEADSGANPAAQPQPQGSRGKNPQATLRHRARQPAGDPMAPRPLHRDEAISNNTASNPEPVPAPAAAPRPIVPSSTAFNSCQGASCSDAAGKRYNSIGGSGSAGVSSAGRLCNRTGATVQCF